MVPFGIASSRILKSKSKSKSKLKAKSWNTIRNWLPAVLAVGTGGVAFGQTPSQLPSPSVLTQPNGPIAMPKPIEPPGASLTVPKPAEPVKSEKLYEVKFDNTEWSKVFEWLEKESGLMYITKDKPTGSLTLKPNKKYTLGQMIDLLNERLELDKFVILRKSESFATIPSDVNIGKDLRQHVQLVTAEELTKRGNTEVVSINIPLVTLQADDIRSQIQKSLSPFGEVTAFGNDQVMVLDKAANVRVVLKLIDDATNSIKDNLIHECKFKRASFVAEMLRTLLADATTQVNATTNAMQPNFGGNQWGGGGWGQPMDTRATKTDTRRFRSINISVDDEKNTVSMTGPADKIIAADKIIKDQDKGDKPRANGGKPVWITYTVTSGTADTMGKLLKERPEFKGSSLQVISIGTNELRVWGYNADHLEIADFLKQPPSVTPSIETKVYALPPSMDAMQIGTLASSLKTAIANGLVADPRPDGEPGIVLRGSPEIIKAAEEYIRNSVGAPMPGGTSSIPGAMTVTIPNANAGALAEHLSEMMRKMGKTPVVNDPSRPTEPPKKPSGDNRPMQPGATSSLSPNRPLYANFQQPNSPALSDPEKKPDVVFNVVGDKIIITGDDPKAVQLAYELLSVYTSAKASKATERYEVIRLKNVSAEEASKVITEIFNGPQQNQQQQQNGRGGFNINPLQLLGLGGGGAAAPADPKAGRVRVVAEKTSNSLIVVKASDIDLITIKDLLKKAINNEDPPEGGVSKTYIIKLQYASASAMSTTIKNVFANYTGNRQRGGGGGGQPFNPFIPQQPTAAQPAALNVDYDLDSNHIVVNCTEPIYQEVRKLCEDLDTKTKDTAEVSEVISLAGTNVTPSQVQQLILAMQGRVPAQQQGGLGGGFGQGGGFPGGGFGQGNGLGGFGGGRGAAGGFGQGGFGQGGGFPGGGFGGGGMGGGTRGGGQGQGGGGTRGGGQGQGGGGTRGGGQGQGGGGTRGGRAQRSEEISAYYDGGGGGQRPFDDAGMDAPSLLFDPEADQPDNGYQSNLGYYGPRPIDVRLASYNEPPRVLYISHQVPAAQAPAQPGAVKVPTPPTTAVVAPSDDVLIIPIDSLGQVVIRAKSKEELERVKAIISLLINSPQVTAAAIAIEIVPLKYVDSTSLVNDLRNVFGQLQLTPTGAFTFPQQRGGFGAGGFGGQFGGQQSLGTLLVFPLPRYNAVLVGAPKGSLDSIKKQIELFDQPNTAANLPVAYPLKNGAASIVQQQILNLFSQRYPSDVGNNIKVTVDTANNKVLVQASPADQKDIATFIEQLDVPTTSGGATNDLKVIKLRNAFASETAQILFEVLQSSVYNPQASTASSGGGASTPVNPFSTGAGGVGGGGLGQQQGGGGQIQLTGGTTASTKSTILRFKTKDGRPIESGPLADVSITPDARINALVVSAPEKTMSLIETLVNELDGVSAAKSFVNVFPLKKTDATLAQQVLVNLFSRQTGGAGGLGGGLGGAGGFGTAQTQGATRPLLTLTGTPGDGASLIDLRLTTDIRSNSLIVAGSQNDLELVRAVLTKLEDTATPVYTSDVVKLKNAAAADVATALTTFLTAQVTNANNLQLVTQAGNSPLGLQRQFNITAEPVTNNLLVSATPALMPEIIRLIQAVDVSPPQVYVEVLIAEVRLNNQEEFGVEVGLQSDVLFARGGASATVPGTPGYNFNTTAALPNAANVNPSKVGFQGLGNLGVGRAGASGIGGFVLSAASDSFSLLIRALKAQGRVDVLSRPALSLVDNQTGFFQVGQQFPRVTASNVTAQGIISNSIEYVPVGVVLRVTPRISLDGQILMRVEPQISAPNQTQVAIGNGVFAVGIDTQTVETSVLAGDGETVVLGGLIRKFDQKLENKIPLLGDIPYLGAAFRYRTQTQERREIVFIMTPRIMRTQADMRNVLAAEARKMSWSIRDAANVSGLDADIFRGKLPERGNIDLIGGPPPTYLPISPSGIVMPYSPAQQNPPQVAPQQPISSAAPQQPVPPAAVTQTPPGGYPVPQPVPGQQPQQPQQPVQPAAYSPPAQPPAAQYPPPAGGYTPATAPATQPGSPAPVQLWPR
jgi:type II secretion system protein D